MPTDPSLKEALELKCQILEDALVGRCVRLPEELPTGLRDIIRLLGRSDVIDYTTEWLEAVQEARS